MFTSIPPRRLTIEEAAKRLHISRSLLQKLTANAEISSIRLGRRRFYDIETLKREIENRGRRDRVDDPSRKQSQTGGAR